MPRWASPAYLLVAAVAVSSSAWADDEPYRAPNVEVRLTGGAFYRFGRSSVHNGLDAEGNPIFLSTRWSGGGPVFGRLQAEGYFLPSLSGGPFGLGVDGEVAGDTFTNTLLDESGAEVPGAARRLAWVGGRVGLSLRARSTVGLFGKLSLGIGATTFTYVQRVTDPSIASGFGVSSELNVGPAGALAVGFSAGPLSVLARAQGVFAPGRVSFIEPGAAISFRVLETDSLRLSIGVDYGWLVEVDRRAETDSLVHVDDDTEVGVLAGPYFARTHRFGVSFGFELLPPRPARTDVISGTDGLARLEVAVLTADGAPASGAKVTLDGLPFGSSDTEGRVVGSAARGAHRLAATLEGFRTAELPLTIEAVAPPTATIRLSPLTGPGSVNGVVRHAVTRDPLGGVTVRREDGTSVQTRADGSYALASIGPGAVKLTFEAQGFIPNEEVVQVPAERATTVDLALEPLGKGSPATVRGLIRAITGEPLKAKVVIKGSTVPVSVNDEGRFVVSVKSGTYSFVVSAPGYVPQTKKLTLGDGEQAIFHCELLKGSR